MTQATHILERSSGRARLSPELVAGIAVLAVATAVFCFEIRAIAPVNGWWYDELFSIWASDPALGFEDVFVHRILHDTNPPLYYTALFWSRRLIPDARAAATFLNVFAITAALSATTIASRRTGLLGWALATGGMFLLSGPVLRYTLEARAYLMALAVAYTAAWFCALAIEETNRRPRSVSFGVIGVIAASVHVFAALICGCLGAGLLGAFLIGKRKELLMPAIALVLSASVVAALWLPIALTSVDRVRWTQLSFQAVFDAYREVRTLALGSRPGTALIFILFGIGLALPSTRRLTALFSLAFALFFLLPILASFKKPVIGGRYWMIGAPCVLVFAAFLTRALFHLRFPFWIGALTGLGFLAIASFDGFAAAYGEIDAKEKWSGATLVGPLLQHCAPGSVHVYTSWSFTSGFAFLTHAPEDLFVAVDPTENAQTRTGASACPVLGWAEHVVWQGTRRLPADFVLAASDDELLRLLSIQASPAEVEIYRHKEGFVVLRRGTTRSDTSQ